MINIVVFTFPRFSENTYLVFDETKECLIADPGCYTNKEKNQIADYIAFLGLRPKLLVNTHCHIDHVLGNKFILDRYKIPLYLHQKEIRFLEAMPRFGAKHGFKIEAIPKSYALLDEGDEVVVGNASFEVLFTPGHSPGSISLFCKRQGILISGDVLFRNRLGSVDLPGGDYDQLLDTIHSRLYPLGKNVRVFPGHGPSTTIGYEMEYNSLVCNWI